MKKFLTKVWDNIGNWIVFLIPTIVYGCLIVFGLITMVSSCSKPADVMKGDSYYRGYDDGYYEGRCEGYSEGIEKAKGYIAIAVDDDLDSLAWDIEDEYGLLPEDALQILSNYADRSGEVSEEELNNAIWAIYRYYYRSHVVTNEIEDYWID